MRLTRERGLSIARVVEGLGDSDARRRIDRHRLRQGLCRRRLKSAGDGTWKRRAAQALVHRPASGCGIKPHLPACVFRLGGAD